MIFENEGVVYDSQYCVAPVEETQSIFHVTDPHTAQITATTHLLLSSEENNITAITAGKPENSTTDSSSQLISSELSHVDESMYVQCGTDLINADNIRTADKHTLREPSKEINIFTDTGKPIIPTNEHIIQSNSSESDVDESDDEEADQDLQNQAINTEPNAIETDTNQRQRRKRRT